MSGATARLISWRPLQKGSLRGFCNIELPSGLVLRDISVHISHGKAWAGLPAKPVIDSGGRHHIVDGKKQYAPIAEWKSKALRAPIPMRPLEQLPLLCSARQSVVVWPVAYPD